MLKKQVVYVEQEKYFWYLPNSEDEFLWSTKTIHNARPKLVQIACPNAVSSIVDDQILPILKRVPLSMQKADEAEYWVHHFKTLEWVQLYPSACHEIGISLLTEDGSLCQFTSGYSTYLIVKIKSYPVGVPFNRMNPTERFVIHVSSKPTKNHLSNTAQHFTVELARRLTFDHNSQWEVGVCHVVYPSLMRMLPSLDMTLKIKNTLKETEDDFTISRDVSTCEEVVAKFKEAIAFTDVAEVETWTTNNLCLKFKNQHTQIEIGSTLAYILGSTITKPGSTLVIDGTKRSNQKWHFVNAIQKIQLLPASLFLYSRNLCQFSMVGDEKAPLLCVIDHQGSKDTAFHMLDHEIKAPNFIPLAQYDVKTIEMFFYAHDMSPISWKDDKAVVFLTLAFQKKRND